MNAGKPSRRSFQSISVTSDIIRKPTRTSAPQVDAELTIEMRGAMNAAAINSRPVKIEQLIKAIDYNDASIYVPYIWRAKEKCHLSFHEKLGVL